MSKLWRIVVLVMLLVAGSLGTTAAQGKPDNPGNGGSGGGGNNGGGPGSGEVCPVAGGAQVVLDPGHGGGDPGAVDPVYGMREADLNLAIAYQTMAMLDDSYTVALTRYDDRALDNSQRGAIANACGALVFVEIHLNASSDPSVNFSSNFYGKKNKDLDFAMTMNGSLSSLGIPNHGVGQFANGGLLHADMPSTLVEAVFLTNPDEAAALHAGTRQPQIASAIAGGIASWIG